MCLSLHLQKLFCVCVCVYVYTHTAWGSLNLPTCWIWYMRSPPLMYSMTKYKRSCGAIERSERSVFTKTGERLHRNESEANIQKRAKDFSEVDREWWVISERIVGQIEKKNNGERSSREWERTDWVVVCASISLQLGEHSNFNLRPNSPPLSTEIANMVQYVRECWGDLVFGHVCVYVCAYALVCVCVFADNIVVLCCVCLLLCFPALTDKSYEQLYVCSMCWWRDVWLQGISVWMLHNIYSMYRMCACTHVIIACVRVCVWAITAC